ncbi:MAG TPA: DUF72 domain-containing protein [Gemmatimonadaceae bacterium]|nr:DUF72 domain-containing protein [Gemmatimonadaceae bacterium]
MARTDIPHGLTSAEPRVGCAGWAIRREHSGRFANIGTHLQRYATLFNCVEINSCFYRPHRFSTYERWAASVPDDFRFAVKLPKVITHELRLVGAEPALEQFLGETSGLGIKRGPILVQLARSFAFDADSAEPFFKELRNRFEGDVVFEPRHETWFTSEVASLLSNQRIARVAADPARVPAAAVPGAYHQLAYYRLHGSPRVYYSAYPAETLSEVARTIEEKTAHGVDTWCIFDNTALGAATSDALAVKSHLLESQRIAVDSRRA